MGIKARLTSSYFLVIFLTILLFIFSIIFFLKQYYYQNIEEMLVNQAEISANFYERYLSDNGLENQSQELLESIALNTDAQVQIIDAKGQVLEDSHDTLSNEQLSSPDVMQALEGTIGIWRGSTMNPESILAISYPLIQDEQTIGAIRLITSLSIIDNAIQRTTMFLILIGLFVIFIVIIISLLLSRTITEPIKNLTKVAERMAKGDFSARLKKTRNDEIGKFANTLAFMAEEISRNEKLKNNFIASISHELRTPLTSIKGWTITLRHDLNHKQLIEEGLMIIEKESDRLSVMLEELLDFSKFEVGKIILKTSNIELNEFVANIYKQMKPRAERQGLHFELQVSHLPSIHGDENRLKQVLINILDNALKFTPPGGSVIINTNTDNHFVKIRIEDTGVGIPVEDIVK